MLSDIFELLEKVKAGLTKPGARITIEVSAMVNDEQLKFQFLWYEGAVLKIGFLVPKELLDSTIYPLSDHIIAMANYELKKYYAEKEKRNDNTS